MDDITNNAPIANIKLGTKLNNGIEIVQDTIIERAIA